MYVPGPLFEPKLKKLKKICSEKILLYQDMELSCRKKPNKT